MVVENGSVNSWFFDPEWTIASPEFKATNTTAGNLVNVRAGKIGPTLLNTRVSMQAKRIDTLRTLSDGITADILAQSIDVVGGGTSVGIDAKKGLIGTITADNVATGVAFVDTSASVLGLAAGSTIRLRSLDSGASINLPVQGLKGQIIINAKNTDPGAWLGTVTVGGVTLNHTSGEYPQTEAQLGGGAVGLVPFKVRVQDTKPPVFAGFRRLHAASFRSGQLSLRPSFYGPILPASISSSSVIVESFDESASQWLTVPAANYSVTQAPNSFGRNLVVTGNGSAPFAPGLYRARFISSPGGLLCDLGLAINPPIASNQSVEFLLTERCFSSGKPHPCDIAYDNGELLPPFGSSVPGWANNGVNEGDYNAFFAANGFFTQGGMGTAAIGMFCDIACDNGDTLTANPGCTNNGVNEGDYNCFFNNFWATACE